MNEEINQFISEQAAKQLSARLDAIYDKANARVQEACDQCSPIQNYVCTYHEGWADGFEHALGAMVLAIFGPPPINGGAPSND